MATDTTSHMESSERGLAPAGWSSLTGRILDGGFELQELVEADETRATFKVRVLGDRDLDCVALFFPAGGRDADRQVELWALTRQLRHPHLSAPLGAGQLEQALGLGAGRLQAFYCVVRRADESLDAVLAERALTLPEAGEALESVARALEVLHLNDMAFGCLSPSRVLAVGDFIKLPAECVRGEGETPAVRVFTPQYLAPESLGSQQSSQRLLPENTTAAADLWCLGATIFEALSQKCWREELRAEVSELPEPFASIALRCLHTDPESRANLGEVMALYRGEIKPLARVRAAVVGSPAAIVLPETVLREDVHASPMPGSQELDHRVVPEGHVESPGIQTVDPKVQTVGAEPAGEPQFNDVPAASSAWHAQALRPSVDRPAQELLRQEPLPAEAEEYRAADVAKAAETSESPAAPQSPHLVRAESAPFASGRAPGEGIAKPPSAYRSSLDDALENRQARRRATPVEENEPATNYWVWVGVMALVVIGLIWALRPKTASVPASKSAAVADTKGVPGALAKAPAASTAPPKGSAGGQNVWQTQTLEPDGSVAKPSPARKEAVNSGNDTRATGAAVWRVVSFTYLHRDDAEKKVQALNARDGGLHAAVFSPSGSGSPYLVVLGGRLKRDDAAQFRRKVIAEGLPRDTYIQNYTH